MKLSEFLRQLEHIEVNMEKWIDKAARLERVAEAAKRVAKTGPIHICTCSVCSGLREALNEWEE